MREKEGRCQRHILLHLKLPLRRCLVGINDPCNVSIGVYAEG